MSVFIPLFFILSLVFSIAAHANQPDYFMQVQADSYAEPVPIHAFIGAWHAPEHSGHIAFLDSFAQTGVHLGNNTLSYTLADDYLLRFPPAMASFYYAYKNSIAPASGTYPVAINVQQIATEGIRWGHSWSVTDNWSWTSGLNLLKGLSLIDGNSNGLVQFAGPHLNAPGFPAANLSINYDYSKAHLHESDINPSWQPNQPSGVGYALDFALHGIWFSHLVADVQVRNVAAKMRWSKTPQTIYAANCQCSQRLYNFNGAMQINPQYEQSLPMIAEAHLQWQMPSQSAVTLDTFSNPLQSLIRLGYAWSNIGQKMLLKLAYEPQTRSVDIECSTANYGIRWQSDALNMNQAYRLGTELFVRIPL